MDDLRVSIQLLSTQQSRCKERVVRFSAAMTFSIWLLSALLYPLPADCTDNTAVEVEKSVERSIETRQETQEELKRWEAQKQELLASYDALIKEREVLAGHNKSLSQELKQSIDSVNDLKGRQQENDKITREIEPFLQQVYSELNQFIEQDIPFLEDERKERMVRLRKVLDDLSLPVSEKFRKVMEALFVEAEYGNTIEVTRQKIRIQGQESDVLADIFRLGRISMFALTLDNRKSAFYDVAERKWSALDDNYLDTIKDAVQMANKQRTVEILSMPLGKIGSKERD